MSDKLVRDQLLCNFVPSMFSKACEYGIKATIYISLHSREGKSVNLKEISKAIDSPEAFTAKILQLLVKNNIIGSSKGPAGGFNFNNNSGDEIKLCRIVSAIDGDNIYTGCGLGLAECNESAPCPVHFQFKAIRDSLKKMLETTTINELALGLKGGLTLLKR